MMHKTLIAIIALSFSACHNEELTTPIVSAEPRLEKYDTVAPEITKWMGQPAILVFSKTKNWRHNEGIAGADRFFADMAEKMNYGLFTTENGAVFNSEDLARFKLVVFNNMTGDTLSQSQQSDFQNWLEAGGGWIGLHGAGDNSHTSWPWYDKKIIGPEFIGHPAEPQFQNARLVTLNAQHPIMRDISAEWEHNDEWYSFDSLPQDYGLTPLIGLDESSYRPQNDVYGNVSDLRMGPKPEDHPILWVGEQRKGRTVYSAIGHSHKSYDDPVNRQLLENMINWVMKSNE